MDTCMKPNHCPNLNCASSNFQKMGSFQRSSDGKKIQRYRCPKCHRTFSDQTNSPNKYLKIRAREFNYKLIHHLCSKESLRRIAFIYKVTPKTVARHRDALALKAKKHNNALLGRLKQKVENIQFDDLITHEHTKLKPLTVSIAVASGTQILLGAQVGQIPAFGHLAKLSVKKYGPRKSEHYQCLSQLFKRLKVVATADCKFQSDEHHYYPVMMRKYFAKNEYKRFKSERACVAGQGELKRKQRDPLFPINHALAEIRDGVTRLVRKTWCNTKVKKNLQKHMDIYLYYHNYFLHRQQLQELLAC